MEPSHEAGYLVDKNMDALTGIYNQLMAGWQDSKGQTCIFRDLRDLASRKKAQFDPLMAATPWMNCGPRCIRRSQS